LEHLLEGDCDVGRARTAISECSWSVAIGKFVVLVFSCQDQSSKKSKNFVESKLLLGFVLKNMNNCKWLGLIEAVSARISRKSHCTRQNIPTNID
jgi:hypothetical protein